MKYLFAMDLSVVNERCFFPASFKHYVHASEHKAFSTPSCPAADCFATFGFHDEKRWSHLLKVLATPVHNCSGLIAVIKIFRPKVDDLSNLLEALSELSQHPTGIEISNSFFEKTIPKMVQAVVSSKSIFSNNLPLLLANKTFESVTLDRKDCFVLLSLAFFGLVKQPKGKFSEFSLLSLFEGNSVGRREKLKCFLQYFHFCATEDVFGQVTFYRKSTPKMEIPKWHNLSLNITDALALTSKIEDAKNFSSIVDFANKYFSGGTLGEGCVQEEIMLCQHTEATIGVLLYEKFGDNDAAQIFGVSKVNDTRGYGKSFKWQGLHAMASARDKNIVIMDAVDYSRCAEDQFSADSIERELCKAYTAFKSSDPDAPPIATGKWGCGVFKGEPKLKIILQLLAASACCRNIHFHLLNDKILIQEFEEFKSHIYSKSTSVANVYSIVKQYCASRTRDQELQCLFNFIEKRL
ncbi:uncharacterized protein LOC132204020 [Neocloeon triangulifer]|uniref:uncharacterized protein LOC132204020 n=1 Tax=Neocloeon triangulifer TaxID=2078957 RepID=UPI00286EC949|nr:uncharacterized protein LOC132204020 [Neocloeon triangulifer]